MKTPSKKIKIKTSIFLYIEDTFKIKQKQARAELCQAHIKLGLVSCWLEDSRKKKFGRK
jgi:hypothetical protein